MGRVEVPIELTPELVAAAPDAPGIYKFLDASGAVVYVGKAKRLRRRLGQYRPATRRKRHRRVRRILKAATSVTWEVAASHLDACLREIRLIQELRPPLNVAGAFSFLYPMIGLAADDRGLRLVLTSRPALFPGVAFHGAFRSREVCAEAYFSLLRLWRYVGHREQAARLPGTPRGTYIAAFRRLPGHWGDLWQSFLRGRSRQALAELALALLDRPDARAHAADVQADLKALQRLWEEEIAPLAQALDATGYAAYPVPQAERDPLFIRARACADSDTRSAGRTSP